jgi:hypothetical protein
VAYIAIVILGLNLQFGGVYFSLRFSVASLRHQMPGKKKPLSKIESGDF